MACRSRRAANSRYHDLDIDVVLSRERSPSKAGTNLLVATVRWEYTVTPANPVRRFTCVSDPGEYRELVQDSAATSVWYFPPAGGLTGADTAAFELVQLSVDGLDRPIRRSAKTGSQTYTVNLGKAAEAGKPVRLAYTYRTLARRDGDFMRLQIGQPTRGVKITFRYEGTGIRHIDVLDFIASSRPTTIERSAPGMPEPKVTVTFDGWAFPQGGVAFVWD